MNTQICTTCNKELSVTKFYKHSSKYIEYVRTCKLCMAWKRKMGLPKIPRVNRDLPNGDRICRMCNEEKMLHQFCKSKTGKFGRDTLCKQCHNILSGARKKKLRLPRLSESGEWFCKSCMAYLPIERFKIQHGQDKPQHLNCENCRNVKILKRNQANKKARLTVRLNSKNTYFDFDDHTRRCRACEERKPLQEFNNSSKGPKGKDTQCRECALKAGRVSYFVNILKKRGLTLELYNSLLKKQKNKCGICGNPFGGSTPCIDHCHSTNKVRGLLCSKCNSGLGLIGDDLKSVRRAEAYLLNN